MNDKKSKEEKILDEVFGAAKQEKWDTSPGFEERLLMKLRQDSGERFSFELSQLVWRVVPVAAAIMILASIAGLALTNGNIIDDLMLTGTLDLTGYETIISSGLF